MLTAEGGQIRNLDSSPGTGPNDNMEYLGNIIVVTVEDLTRSDDGDAVMTSANYKQLAHRGKFNIIRQGKGLGHPALIEWSSLPERFKAKLRAKYGDPETVLNRGNDMLKIDEAARSFFADYRLPDGSALKSDHQMEYTINASVLTHMHNLKNIQKSRRAMSGNTTPVNWSAIISSCESMRDVYGHTLPKNEARLRAKLRQFEAEGYACLVSGKLNNGNSIKITEAAGRQIIAWKRSRIPVYTVNQIFEKFNAEAEGKGWKPLKSINTLVEFLERPEVMVQWKDTEQGELMTKNIYTRKFSTIMPSVRDAVWYGDGTRLNLYYKQYTQNGYKASCMQVYEVVDAFTETFIGYNISEAENFESMYEAVRNAIENTQSLPVEMVFDNQGGTKRADAQLWLSKIATCSRPTAPNNPTSKSIESIFGRFQQEVLHEYWYFTGGNITARSDRSRFNAEFIMANVDALPTKEELFSIYAECRKKWNSMRHPKYDKSRAQLYADSANAQATTLTDTLRRELFWLTSREECTYTNAGITVTINKQKYTFEVLDAEGLPDVQFLSNNAGRKFIVQYDPHDLSVVRLCTRDQYGDKFITEAKPYLRNHRAMMDQEEGERSLIIAIDNRNKKERVRRQMNNMALEYEFGVAPEQHGLETPRLKGISSKEYEKFADEIRAEQQAKVPGEVLPATIGQLEKEQSNFDVLSIYDRM